MARISTYPVDSEVIASDKWIGSDFQNSNQTKNFTPITLANFLNHNQVIDYANSLRYFYQTLDPGENREVGSISFPTEIGVSIPFSTLTNFILSNRTLKQNEVTEYLDFLIGSKITISNSSNTNLFGFYEVLDISTYIPDSNFLNVSLEYIVGNGEMLEDTDYLISLVDKASGDAIPTLTSELTNDGEDGVNPFISLADLPYQIEIYPDVESFPTVGQDELIYFAEYPGTFYLWNGEEGDYDQITSNAFPTGLERITEGTNTGWRLIGRNRTYYGPIGMGAVDLSFSNSASEVLGATGPNSFAVGQSARASGQSSASVAGNNNRATGIYSFIGGGSQSDASGNNTSVLSGYFAKARSFCEHVIGSYNTDYTPTSTTVVSPTDRSFVIGAGTIGNLKDVLTVYKNGAVKFFVEELANITNGVAGFFTFNSTDSNRPYVHNGTEWKGLAYVGEGGTQNLNEVLVEGNATNGEDIFLSDGDAILLDNGSKLKKGTTNAGNGGNNGVALKCSLDYELKWEAGRLYIMEQDGIQIRETSHNFNIGPEYYDDITKGFVVGSRWILDDGTLYTCSDNTLDNAVWEVVTQIVPSFQEVTDIGSDTTNAVGSTSAFYVGAFIDWLSGNTAASFMAMYADMGLVIKDYGAKAPMIFKNKLNDNTVTLLAQNKPESDYLIADTEDIAALQTQITANLEGVTWKLSARIAIDTPLAMSGSVPLTPTLTIQGVTLIDNDRVILIAQANPIYNGIYRVNDVLVSGNYRLYRTNDANSTSELNNAIIPIGEGTYVSKIFRQTTVNPIINTNSIVFDYLVPNVPTKTSDLINDGDDGNPFISLLDLPSNIIFYPTTVASDISGYVKIVTSITDPSYNTTAVDVSTGAITTTNQLISNLATSPNIIVGNPGVFNITTIGNIRRISGSGQASFYFQVYKRTSGGVETLIATSDNTIPVIDGGTYVEFSATGIWNDGIFLDTDRVVMKYYANRISGGSNPTYEFQFGGVTPVRTLVPIPLSVVPILTIDAVPTDGSTNAVSSNGVFDALALNTSFLNEDFSFNNLINNTLGYFFPNQNAATFTNLMRTANITLSGNTAINTPITRIVFSTTATAGTLGFLRGAVLSIDSYSSTYFFSAFLKFDISSNVSGTRFFAGWSRMYGTTAPTNVEPDTMINSIGVCKLSTSENLHILHNDATGTATTVDLGVNYPANNVDGYVYILKLSKQIGSTDVLLELQRNSFDGSGITISTSYVISTNLPAPGVNPAIWICNNATATIASFESFGGVINKNSNY